MALPLAKRNHSGPEINLAAFGPPMVHLLPAMDIDLWPSAPMMTVSQVHFVMFSAQTLDAPGYSVGQMLGC